MAPTPSDLSRDPLLRGLTRDASNRPLLNGIALLCRLGSGGYGAVYYALHPRLGIEVAVKVLLPALSDSEQRLRRLRQEAKLTASLSSEHVVRVLDVDDDTGLHFIVMEFVPGLSAQDLAKNRGVSERDALRITIAACQGLAAAHRKRIVHRDVKPGNILVPDGDPDGAKLTDLGLAKSLAGDGEELTRSSVWMGTLGFASPEQLRDGKNVGPAADVFGLGATLHFLLSGEAPFATSEDTLEGRRRPLSPAVGPRIRILVEHCLAVSPADRFPDAVLLLRALQAHLEESASASGVHVSTIADRARTPTERERQSIALETTTSARQHGDAEKAIAEFSRAIELDPLDPMAYVNRGNAQADNGEFGKAMADYAKALELNPRCSHAYANRGWRWYERGDFDNAIADFTKAVKHNPRDDNAYTGRGFAWEKKGNWDNAIADHSKALQIDSSNADTCSLVYQGRGHQRIHEGIYDEAIADFSKAIDLNPKSAGAYHARGLAWQAKRNIDRAIADYSAAIDIAPDADGYDRRGRAWARKGDFVKAMSDFAQALALNPSHADAYYHRGDLWSERGERDNAISDYSKAIDHDAQHADAHHCRGDIWAEKGDLDKAIADYSRAIEIDPSASRYDSRGKVWAIRGEFDKAMSDYARAIELNPRYAAAYFSRGVLWSERAENDKAIADYSKAIQHDPQHTDAYNNRGCAWYEKGNHEKAIADYTKAIKINPRAVIPTKNRGNAHFRARDFDRAIHDYSTALSTFLPPLGVEAAELLYGRSKAHQGVGDMASAAADMARALGIAPEFATDPPDGPWDG